MWQVLNLYKLIFLAFFTNYGAMRMCALQIQGQKLHTFHILVPLNFEVTRRLLGLYNLEYNQKIVHHIIDEMKNHIMRLGVILI